MTPGRRPRVDNRYRLVLVAQSKVVRHVFHQRSDVERAPQVPCSQGQCAEDERAPGRRERLGGSAAVRAMYEREERGR